MENNILSNYGVLYVGASYDIKLGFMSCTYTSNNSCSTSCRLYDICYAKNDKCAIHWKRAITPIDQLQDLMNRKGSTHLLRHNVAGDIATPGTNEINEDLLYYLCKCYKYNKAFTYTHCDINERNMNLVKQVKNKFVINFSCESIEDVEKCVDNNMPCVLTVASMNGETQKHDNYILVKCHGAEERNGKLVQCVNCKMCTKYKRTKNKLQVVPVFEVHGAKKNKGKEFLLNI